MLNTKTIKLTVEETVQKEVEVKLPIHIRKGNYHYLIKGKEYGQTIAVYSVEPYYSISCSTYKLAFDEKGGWTEISKEEFEKAFDKAIEGLTKKIKLL